MEFYPYLPKRVHPGGEFVAPPGGELSGRRVALIGFEREWASRFYEIMQTAGAFCIIAPNAEFEAEARHCDLVLLYLRAGDDPPDTEDPATSAAVIIVMRASTVAPRGPAVDYIFYPCTPIEILTRAAIAIERKRASVVRSRANPFRILIVDDDPEVHALLHAALDGEDMKCQSTSLARESLRIARGWNPDLIILDVNMPGLSGHRVLTALKASSSNRRTPVVLLTGCDHKSDVIRGFDLGAQDYVVKPFHPADIAARVRRIVTKSAR
ncbi:MAG TPA: response regulator transcription factor [Bryobacteraceae bacterium]|jgi:CheY-like chemotaxis protein